MPKNPELGETLTAAIEGNRKPRFLVWLQTNRQEGVVFEEADYHYLVTGSTEKYGPEDIGIGALADDMRERLLDDDVKELLVQEFTIADNGFDFVVTGFRSVPIVGDDEDEGDDPPGSYNDHCSKV